MSWAHDAAQDVRYAIRSFRQSPAFAATAILTLALGIGATTAIYSVVDTVLLQPLPYADSDRLVRVIEYIPFIDASRPPSQRGPTYQEFLEWRSRSTTLTDAVASIGMAQRTARTSNGTARLWGTMVSGQTFALFGARTHLGRGLGPGDEAQPDVIVITYDTWRHLFQSDPQVVGTKVELGAPQTTPRVLTLIGVLAADVELPTGTFDFYTPIALDPSRPSPAVTMIARLRPGVTAAAAVDEANALGSAIRPPRPANAPALPGRRFDVQGVKDRMVEPLRPALRVLLAAVGVVLLIVCANVANLLLARGTARQREIAVRFAVGAGRGRIVRQLLTECVVLAAAGGVLGAMVSAGVIMMVKRMATIEAPGIFRLVFGATILPRAVEIGVDGKMLGIAFGTAALTCLVFGLAPALRLARADRIEALTSRGGTRRGDSRLRAALTVGQLMMATVLLVGAGLLIRSFTRLTAVETGFDPSHVVAAQLVFPADYPIARKANTIDAILTRLRALPGVEAAGFSRAGILIGEELVVGTFVPPGRALADMRADPVRPRLRSVSRGYLTAMGVRLIAGRELEATDTVGAPTVILVSRAVAQRFFPGGNAVGQYMEWYPNSGKAPGVQAQIVGVVTDIHNTSPDREPVPEVYAEYRQLIAIEQQWGDAPGVQDVVAIGFLSLAIRTAGDPFAAIPALARAVRDAEPNAGIESMLPMDRLVFSSLARQRFYAVLLAVFAGVATLLAAIGIYGVLAYAVVQRTREIGIRMALGAQRAQVMALVLRQGAILTAAGIAAGLAGAVAATRVLQGLLFSVTPLDPTTFTAVAVLFVLVAGVASWLPARRATRVDPLAALRAE